MSSRLHVYQLLSHYIQEHSSAVHLLSFHASCYHLWVSTFCCIKRGCASQVGTIIWFLLYVLPWALAAMNPSRWAQIVLSSAIYSAVIPHFIWAIMQVVRISRMHGRRALLKSAAINGLLTILLLFNPTIPFKPDYGLAIQRAFPLVPFRNAFLPITLPGALPLEMPLYVHISYILIGGIVIPVMVHIYLLYLVAFVIAIYRLCCSCTAKKPGDQDASIKSCVDTDVD